MRRLVAGIVVSCGVLGLGGCPDGTGPLHVRTSDGFTIEAQLSLPPREDQPAPLVVLGHQLDRDRHGWDPLVPRLLDEGYAVLAVDHRGFGGSTREAASPADLSMEARARLELDLREALHAAARRKGVDGERVAVIGSGLSATAAVRCARDEASVRAVAIVTGLIEIDAAEFLLDSPDLPLLMVAASGDERGVGLMRQYASRFTGPAQQYVELGPVAPGDPADWRGTDGLVKDSGLADLLVWFLQRNLPAGAASGPPSPPK